MCLPLRTARGLVYLTFNQAIYTLFRSPLADHMDFDGHVEWEV
jgi:hypothetical protein